MSQKRSWSAYALLGGLALVGLLSCARSPNPALERAEADLAAARADPAVTQHAAVPLHEAEQSVDRAERAFEEGDDDAEVNHLAYLASRRIEIARALTTRNSAVSEMKQLGNQREAVVLDARTREANRARAEARVAESEADALSAELSSLRARDTDAGLVVSVDDVLFEVDRAELTPGAMPDLSRLATYLRAHPDRNVRVEGHTDVTGSASYNQKLSQMRAESVRNTLISLGVDPRRILAQGFGASAPIASNATEAGRLINRRVDIVVAPATGVGALR